MQASRALEMKRIRFRINCDRCIQGMQYIACNIPGVTLYHTGKVFYFADRVHLIDWGRPISGDRYVAMDHGPVPSIIYNITTKASEQPDEISDAMAARLRMVRDGNKIRLYSTVRSPDLPALAESDREYLYDSLSKYGNMSFGALRELSHQDEAYANAWNRSDGRNNEMNPMEWFTEHDDPDAVYAGLSESSVVDRHFR